ncbi:MAG: O-antigen ligase family protein [Pseudomonadota bacterium]
MPAHPPSRAFTSDVPVYAAVVLGYILLLPPQLNLSVFGSVLPPYRFFLIPSLLFVFAAIFKGRLKIVWPDILVMLAAAWITLALFMTTEQSAAFTASFAQITDIAFAYLFGRAAFTSLRDVRVFLLLMLPGLAIIGGLMILESLSNTHIIQPFFAELTGQSFRVRFDERLGLMRSRGPFPHPILAGIFIASFLPLYFMSGFRRWPWIIGSVAAFASFFTVSSAALLALVAGGGLIAYNWLSERIVNLTWKLFFVGAGLVMFVLEMGTNSGAFNLIMRFGSLNSYSAYNRVLIWKYGTKNVEKNPWFGIGYEDWERPEWMVASIDHYWLILAIQFGFIPPFLIAIATFIAVYTLIRRTPQNVSPMDVRFQRGIAIAMSVFALGAISVALWLQVQVWFFVLLAITVSVGHASIERPQQVRRPMPKELWEQLQLSEAPTAPAAGPSQDSPARPARYR